MLLFFYNIQFFLFLFCINNKLQMKLLSVAHDEAKQLLEEKQERIAAQKRLADLESQVLQCCEFSPLLPMNALPWPDWGRAEDTSNETSWFGRAGECSAFLSCLPEHTSFSDSNQLPLMLLPNRGSRSGWRCRRNWPTWKFRYMQCSSAVKSSDLRDRRFLHDCVSRFNFHPPVGP